MILAATFAFCYAMTGFLMVLDHRSQSPIDAPLYVGTSKEGYAIAAWPHVAAVNHELGYRAAMLVGFVAHTQLWILLSGWWGLSAWVGLGLGALLTVVPVANLTHQIVGGVLFLVLRLLGASMPGHVTRPGSQ